jgi:hypothetical protein
MKAMQTERTMTMLRGIRVPIRSTEGLKDVPYVRQRAAPVWLCAALPVVSFFGGLTPLLRGPRLEAKRWLRLKRFWIRAPSALSRRRKPRRRWPLACLQRCMELAPPRHGPLLSKAAGPWQTSGVPMWCVASNPKSDRSRPSALFYVFIPSVLRVASWDVGPCTWDLAAGDAEPHATHRTGAV